MAEVRKMLEGMRVEREEEERKERGEFERRNKALWEVSLVRVEFRCPCPDVALPPSAQAKNTCR
jgi:hypothetical protein